MDGRESREDIEVSAMVAYELVVQMGSPGDEDERFGVSLWVTPFGIRHLEVVWHDSC